MNELGEVGRMLVEIQRVLDACGERGPEFDQLQGTLNRAVERFKAFPKKVADQAPFATAGEVEAVLTREVNYILAALDG